MDFIPIFLNLGTMWGGGHNIIDAPYYYGRKSIGGQDKILWLSPFSATCSNSSRPTYFTNVSIQEYNRRAHELNNGREKEALRCDCGKVMKDDKEGRRHIRNCGQCECQSCHKKFSSKTLLQKHKKTHTESYKCEICGKSFSGSGALARHQDKHNGKKFSCNNCQATFATKGNLTRHVKKSHWAKIRWLSLFFHKSWIHTKNTSITIFPIYLLLLSDAEWTRGG